MYHGPFIGYPVSKGQVTCQVMMLQMYTVPKFHKVMDKSRDIYDSLF